MSEELSMQEMGKKNGAMKHLWFYSIFEKAFELIRYKKLTVVELGVRSGGSIKLWRDYFPNSTIIGVDIDPVCLKTEGERIKILNAGQDSQEVKDFILENSDSEFGPGADIIIDDASHITVLTLASLKLLLPILNYDGIYVIEDLHCSYLDFAAANVLSRPGMCHNDPNVDLRNDKNRNMMNDEFWKLIKMLDGNYGKLSSIQFYPYLCLLFKISKDCLKQGIRAIEGEVTHKE